MRISTGLVGVFAAALLMVSVASATNINPLSHRSENPLFGVTGPGHGTSIGVPGNPTAKTRTVRVTMTDDMRYVPSTILVSRGETVRIEVQNSGQIDHELVLGAWDDLVEHAELMKKFPEMEHDDPNAIGVPPRQTKALVWRFTKAGTFHYGCLHPGHFEAGMVGKIVVR